MLIAIGMSFGLITIVKEFVPLFLGSGFEKCVEVISVLAVSIVFSAAAQIIRTQYLIPFCKDWQYIISLCIGALINVIVNLIFIKKYGSTGAAMGTVAAEFVVCITQFIFSAKEVKIIIYIIQIFMFCVMGSLMCFVCNLINNSNVYLLLIAKICVGILVYGFMSAILLINKHFLRRKNKIYY
jgi:O-antigen/teichoic acid export membrane protein